MKHQRFLQPHGPLVMPHRSIIPSGFPVPFAGSPVHPPTIPIFLVQCTEKIPLLVPSLQP